MAEIWYYTCEGKQMDPVSIRDLKQLVGDGVLKPTDMVWKEGLPRWIRASTLKDLFPDPATSLDRYFSSAPADMQPDPPGTTSLPAPQANSRPRADDEEEARPTRHRRRPYAEDDGERDRSRRRRPAPSGEHGTQILIASLVGGFVLLAVLVIGILILARPKADAVDQARRAAGMPPPQEEIENQQDPDPPVKQPKEPINPGKDNPPPQEDVKKGNGVLPIAVRLAPGAEHIVKFRVKAGHAASITVAPSFLAPGKNIDLNLQVFNDSDNALVAADETPNASASVSFTLPATQIVRVRVHNASKTVTVTQFTIVYNVGN